MLIRGAKIRNSLIILTEIVMKPHLKQMKQLFLILFALLPLGFMNAQHQIRYTNKDLATLTYGTRNQDGFRVQLSLVAMFTAGADDRNGFRLGGGLSLSQTVGNWTFSAGADLYKERQKFGLGVTYAGVNYDDGRYGATYYVNKYYQGDKQISGMIRLHLHDFRINFEDDILAFPFTRFKIYDRYRSAALEVMYKDFILGMNVYTTDINGQTDISHLNSKGVYRTGKQISSPIFIGYATHGMIVRYGFNSKLGGYWGQNGWHRAFFNTADFKNGGYRNQFFQIGVNKPYTLY